MALQVRSSQPRHRRTSPSSTSTAHGGVSDGTSCRLQSKTVYAQTIGTLYRTVELNETVQCCTTLDMLYRHPDIARHVRKLVVRQGGRPDNHIATGSTPTFRLFSHLASSRVCAAVKRAAARMDALQSFVWGGEECPSEDDVWLVLRESCVRLSPSFTSRAC
jgi:hypothetical protein